MPDGTTIPGLEGFPGVSVLNDFLSTNLTSGVTGEALIEQSFNRWDELSGLSFVREFNDDGRAFRNSIFDGVLGVRGDIRIGGQMLDGPNACLLYTSPSPRD